MSNTYSAEPASYVDGATDILDDLRLRKTEPDMSKICAALGRLGYPASTI